MTPATRTVHTTRTPAYLTGLNPEQREAVEHGDGPALVLAGAGSGKTRVLTTRIVHLIRHHDVLPGRILAVTFTNKAAREMKRRIAKMLEDVDTTGLWVGTFHSFGAYFMRRHADLADRERSFTIFDAEQSLRLVKKILETMDVSKQDIEPKEARNEISAMKNALISADDAMDRARHSRQPLAELLARVYVQYERELQFQNALDFDDLLEKPVRILRENPDIAARWKRRFGYVLVDEYQDTNHAQAAFVRLILDSHDNLMCVGDDDQSIYGWRGADISNILRFEDLYPGVRIMRLEQNYRSTERILHAANEVIRNNVGRMGKTLRTDNGPGEPIGVLTAETGNAEAEWVAREVRRRMMRDPNLTYDDFAVLYRTNAQSRLFEMAFRKAKLPFVLVGGVGFYDRREVKDAIAYVRLVANPRDAASFDRVVNFPRRGIGDRSLDALYEWSRANEKSPIEAAAQARRIDGVSAQAGRALEQFATMILRLAQDTRIMPAAEAIEKVVSEAKLIESLRAEKEGGEERAANVRELISAAAEFDANPPQPETTDEDEPELSTTERFLQQTALASSADEESGDEPRVTLMTLHAAKGLEFPFIFLVGLEEGLFPHERSRYDHDEMEEERRLFYVGVTRAMKKLYLLRARFRQRGADWGASEASTFLREVPRDVIVQERAV